MLYDKAVSVLDFPALRVILALFVSEPSYALYVTTGRLKWRARAAVRFDRALNAELDRLDPEEALKLK